MFAIEVATSPAIRYSGAYLLVHAYVGTGRWGRRGGEEGGEAEGQRGRGRRRPVGDGKNTQRRVNENMLWCVGRKGGLMNETQEEGTKKLHVERCAGHLLCAPPTALQPPS